jgi:ABC-type phosphate transport system ATPase subunit
MSWPVSRLSTGEKQRLALLRAIVQGPSVLLLDEPTSALDPEATSKVESVLHEKIQAGVSLILVTHDAAQAKRMSQQRFLMADGRLTPEVS